jgi:hypothetical protein
MNATTNQWISTPHARLAYRIHGNGQALTYLLLLRFRGTMNYWDPSFVSVLVERWKVVVLDGTGMGNGDHSVNNAIEVCRQECSI